MPWDRYVSTARSFFFTTVWSDDIRFPSMKCCFLTTSSNHTNERSCGSISFCSRNSAMKKISIERNFAPFFADWSNSTKIMLESSMNKTWRIFYACPLKCLSYCCDIGAHTQINEFWETLSLVRIVEISHLHAVQCSGGVAWKCGNSLHDERFIYTINRKMLSLSHSPVQQRMRHSTCTQINKAQYCVRACMVQMAFFTRSVSLNWWKSLAMAWANTLCWHNFRHTHTHTRTNIFKRLMFVCKQWKVWQWQKLNKPSEKNTLEK